MAQFLFFKATLASPQNPSHSVPRVTFFSSYFSANVFRCLIKASLIPNRTWFNLSALCPLFLHFCTKWCIGETTADPLMGSFNVEERIELTIRKPWAQTMLPIYEIFNTHFTQTQSSTRHLVWVRIHFLQPGSEFGCSFKAFHEL